MLKATRINSGEKNSVAPMTSAGGATQIEDYIVFDLPQFVGRGYADELTRHREEHKQYEHQQPLPVQTLAPGVVRHASTSTRNTLDSQGYRECIPSV